MRLVGSRKALSEERYRPASILMSSIPRAAPSPQCQRCVSRRDVPQHFLNLSTEALQISINNFERALRKVPIEVPRKGDFVALLRLLVVDPRIGHVRQHLSLKVSLNVLL